MENSPPRIHTIPEGAFVGAGAILEIVGKNGEANWFVGIVEISPAPAMMDPDKKIAIINFMFKVWFQPFVMRGVPMSLSGEFLRRQIRHQMAMPTCTITAGHKAMPTGLALRPAKPRITTAATL